ncbi:winged helix-turn-helix transcriptional regulator [Clostridium hydrogeniformans]|uniref:winged helix-turn-helix transcriptional regulator n=1 Tax=Clostridium hydrogeniformans TaxID=349933 RepID=UPI0004840181|nr:helix-turn-helix domain-containing protein [Clostridium hydrogeniformans]
MDEKIEINSEPFEYTLSIIGGKWKMVIMFWLSKCKVMRYGELKKSVKGITHKMLSSQLKELESDNIIVRKEYHQVPPKVEYFLSERGWSLMPILHEMCKWGGVSLEENSSKALNS